MVSNAYITNATATINVINIIGFKQLKNLYEYAQSNLNTIESNIDEHVGSTAEEQIEENYIAFNMGKIKELSKILPDFDIMLKCGLVENLAENIFIIRFLTPDFLRR